MLGGKVDLESSHTLSDQYKNYSFANTCSIDYLLLCLWFCKKLNNNLFNELKDNSLMDALLVKKIISIVEWIDENDWNKAKSIWIIEVCRLLPCRRIFNFEDSEFSILFRSILFKKMKYIVLIANAV